MIGRGAMGVVYKAHDPEIDRALAIKLVRADLLDSADKQEFLLRFRREAQAAARCAHPNIVAVYDFALHDGDPFIAMEYLPSTSLAQVFAAAPGLPPQRALGIARQVLAGLAAAHRSGVIHRDIKPANILLAADDTAKVTDFGVARLDRSDMTQTGSMIGTLSYMAPEQCRGDPVDHRADLFSAAAVLYEALTGERAFPGRTEPQIIQNLLCSEPAALAEADGRLGPRLLDPGVSAILRRALSKQPADRYPDAEAFSAALAAIEPERAQADAQDGTLVQPRAATARLPAGPVFDAAMLGTLERRLARYLGPIARHLVAGAARETESMAALCTRLAAQIGEEAERASFLRETLGQAAPAETASSTVTASAAMVKANAALAIDAGTLAEMHKELTRYIGPIAPVLIRKALQRAPTLDAFLTELLGCIDNAADRAAFHRRFAPGR